MENKVVNRSNIRQSNPVAMLKKNAMLIILVLVYIFFTIMTKGRMFKSTSFASLINQNAYVYILGCGMLMCMLTGGNIDLSCGAFVCIGEVCEEHGLSGGLEFRNRKAPGLDPGWEDQGGGTTIMGCQFFLAHETMEIKGLYMPPLFF